MIFLATPDPALNVTDLQAIIDSSADCIKVLDLDARLLSMNAGGMETMEIADFIVCHNLLWPSFWEGDARAQVEQALDAARTGQTTTFEGPARTFAGTPRWWEVRVSPLRAPDGIIRESTKKRGREGWLTSSSFSSGKMRPGFALGSEYHAPETRCFSDCDVRCETNSFRNLPLE